MITLALGRGSSANVRARCLLPNAIQVQDLKLCAPSQCTLLLSATSTIVLVAVLTDRKRCAPLL